MSEYYEKACYPLCVLVVFAPYPLQAQAGVSQREQSGTQGPSLEVTMKFIETKLDNEGSFDFLAYVRDNDNGGKLITVHMLVGATSTITDAANCRIGSREVKAASGHARQGNR